MVPDWIRIGSGLDPDWFRIGSGLVPDLIRIGGLTYNPGWIGSGFKILNPLRPLVPKRNLNNCPVFQSWRSNSLPSNTVCYCLRSGLLLYGIVDQSACPTQYRKAASTLMSMHNPSMLEPLSQFMCHERSTAERHYRHHMSHRYLSSVFTELAKCQTNPDEAYTLEKVSDSDLNDPVLLSEPVVEHSTSAGCIDHNNSQDPNSDSLNHSLVSISLTTDQIGELIELVTDEDNLDSSNECTSPRYSDLHEEFPYKSKYSRKRNGKSIFPNQYEEDLFFWTFESLIEKSLSHEPVTNFDVINLAKSKEFKLIWERLVTNFSAELNLDLQ